jgi:hypothetical protein
MEVLDLTSLTVDEFRRLVPAFEAVFQAHMAEWCLDRQPHTTRRYTTYQNCPLPTPEDRLLCIVVYLQTYPLQVVQGWLFGLGQSKARQWIHVLLGVLRATLRAPGDAPTRCLTELATRVRGARGRSDRDGGADGWTAAHTGTCFAPFGHERTERRIGRPQDLLEQTRYERGKKKTTQ